MSSNSHGNGNDSDKQNLVLFPASKNFPRVSKVGPIESGNDPMSELLHEYSHLRDEDIPSYLDDRFELDQLKEEGLDFLEEGDSYDSLEAFMNRHQKRDVIHPDTLLIQKINERIEAILEARARIKFYLDEIEMFLPSKRS